MLKPHARLGIMLLISLALSLAAIMLLLLHDLGMEAGQIFQAMLAALDSSAAEPDSHAAFILWEMRMPRVLVGAGCGAALGVAGAMVQSITRNPLGSPDLMGVSAGAALMMIVGFLLADTTPLGLLALGTLGGFIAGAMTFMMVWRTRLDPLFLTLSGMSVAIFCSAGIMLLLVGAANEANGLYFWLIGSLEDRGWRHVLMLYPWLLLGLPLGLLLGRRLDMLLLGEDVCHGLGLNVLWWRAGLGLLVVILTAATVAVSGPIAFVGLVVPHMVRQCLGRHIAHQLLLPCSAMVGATLMLVADAVAHAAGIPVGIMAIVIGAPVLLKLIHRQVQ